jgi:hypothetical protein
MIIRPHDPYDQPDYEILEDRMNALDTLKSETPTLSYSRSSILRSVRSLLLP